MATKPPKSSGTTVILRPPDLRVKGPGHVSSVFRHALFPAQIGSITGEL
jgi:hypothetical protein